MLQGMGVDFEYFFIEAIGFIVLIKFTFFVRFIDIFFDIKITSA